MDTDLKILSQSVTEADSLESLTRPLLKLIKSVGDLPTVFLTTVDQGKQHQRVLFSDSSRTLEIPEGFNLPWDQTLCRRALEEERYVIENVPAEWPDIVTQMPGLKLYVTVPVTLASGRLFGTLCGANTEFAGVAERHFDLLKLCSELIARQVERDNYTEQAEQRAQQAEARLRQLHTMNEISRACLEASRLTDAVQKVCQSLANDSAWIEVSPVTVSPNGVQALGETDPSNIKLVEAVCRDDQSQLELIIKNQLEPLIWVEAENPTLVAVVTSDDQVEAAFVVRLTTSPDALSDSMQLLNGATNALSLLASRLSDHERLEAANQVLAHHALHDALTGLPNRRFLIDALEAELAQVERMEAILYIAFIDLDGFKMLNDKYGHEVGDEFLRAFANRLNSVLRGHDLVARYGGDEFVFVGVGNPDDDIDSVKKAITKRIFSATSGKFILSDTQVDYQGPSVGIIHWQPGASPDVDKLLSEADEAMYRDKQRRRQHT